VTPNLRTHPLTRRGRVILRSKGDESAAPQQLHKSSFPSLIRAPDLSEARYRKGATAFCAPCVAKCGGQKWQECHGRFGQCLSAYIRFNRCNHRLVGDADRYSFRSTAALSTRTSVHGAPIRRCNPQTPST